MILKLGRLVWFFAIGLIICSSHGVFGKTPETVAQAPLQLSTADHSSFEVLQQRFKSGMELTKACLSCHNL
ncbi:MAG: hypothetical protein AB2793_18150, partial [Candidatus Thiodiazotropha sp.]